MFKKSMIALFALTLGVINLSAQADERDGRRYDDRPGEGRFDDRRPDDGRRGGGRWGDGRRREDGRRRIDRQYIRLLAADLEQQSAALQEALRLLPGAGYAGLDRNAYRLSMSARNFRDRVLDRSFVRDLLFAFRDVEADFQYLYSGFVRAMSNQADEVSYYSTLRVFADVGEIYATIKDELRLSDDEGYNPPPPPRPEPPLPPPPPPRPPVDEAIYVSNVDGLVSCQDYDSVDVQVHRSGTYRVEWSYVAGEAYNWAMPTFVIKNKTTGVVLFNQKAGTDARYGFQNSGSGLVRLESGMVYTMKQDMAMRLCRGSGSDLNRKTPVRSTMRVVYERR